MRISFRPDPASGDILDQLHQLQADSLGLAALFDDLPVGVVVVDPKGRFSRVNSAFRSMIGEPESDPTGKPLTEALPESMGSAFADLFREALQSKSASSERTLRVEATGEHVGRILRARLRPIEEDPGQVAQVVGVVEDVTDSLERESRLRESEERFRLVAGTVPGIVYEWNARTGEILYLSGVDKLLGLSTVGFQSIQPFLKRIHPEDRRDARVAVQSVLEGRGEEYEVSYRLRHGLGHWLHFWDHGHVQRDQRGEPTRVLGSATNLTALREAEIALSEANRQKDHFLSLLGHELRSPLGVIHMGFHLLTDPKTTEDSRDEVKTMIDHQLKHLNRLMDDLLDLSRISRGKIKLIEENLDLAELLSQAVDACRFEARGRGTRVIFEPAKAPPVKLFGDATRLSQVFRNLLNNSIKYSPSRSRVWVELSVLDAGEEAEVVIRDEGMGIAPEDLEGIFQPFTQCEGANRTSSEGLGLGLSLVKSLVDLHDGVIRLESEGRGKGTIARVRLPLNRDTRRARTGDASAPDQADANASGLRVLVIGNHANATQTLKLFLEFEGHEPSVAEDVESGLARAHNGVWDLILCDVGSPGNHEGRAVSREIREHELVPEGRLIALSAHAEPTAIESFREAGFDDFLAKPVEPEKLRDLLKRVTHTRSAGQDLP